MPVVQVAVQDRPPRILPPIPARALRAQAGGAVDGAFPHHLGLTVFSVESRSEITVRTQATEAGACALPAEVRLALVQTEHTIRLAREVPPGSCLAGEVLARHKGQSAARTLDLVESLPEALEFDPEVAVVEQAPSDGATRPPMMPSSAPSPASSSAAASAMPRPSNPYNPYQSRQSGPPK